ncbi:MULTISPECIES: hypothetical protein [unclassified Paenibacillus]|uniref:hypothetical protein n=1 Tax=unclassified Paenibacillus TaxID=185978 RepID=UPI0024BB155D|nr:MULTISPECIES: hypothetical protein [unclassified Paenibacillus]
MWKKGNKALAAVIILGATLIAPAVAPSKAAAAGLSASEQSRLVEYWSPVLYQDVGNNPEGDIPIPVNFDGDWSGLNNWDNIGKYAKGSSLPLKPSVYWSVVESDTHYFIGYDLFYATHDPRGTLGDHENDMEGMMFTIRKPGTAKKDGTRVTNPNGELELALMPRHAKLGMYGPANKAVQYDPGMSSVYYDSNFTTETNASGTHPLVYSAQNDESFLESDGDFGHALKPYNGKGAKGKSGYIFQAGTPVNLNASGGQLWDSKIGNFDDSKRMGYELIPLETSLWPLRNDFTLDLWSSYGTFKGDNGRANAANAPWGWSFENYRDLGSGRMLYDPAYLVDKLFDGLGEFSLTYSTNPYSAQ